MRSGPDAEDYVIIPPDTRSKVSNRSSQQHQMMPQMQMQMSSAFSDSSRNRYMKEFQEEIDRLKLENYHLKDQLESGRNHQKMRQLEEENDQLKSMLKRSSEGGQFPNNDKYDRALREISKLLKINNQLRAELEYSRESNQRNRNEGGSMNQEQLLNELAQYEERNRFLEKEIQEISYKLADSSKGKDLGGGSKLFEYETRLKEKEADYAELQQINQKNEREYIQLNNRLQKTIQDQEMQIKIMQKQFRIRQLELREELQEYDKRQKTNERELQSIKTQAGYFHNEVKDLKYKLEQYEMINQELKREMNQNDSSASESSTFGELKVYINNLNNEVQNLRQFNLNKDTNQLLAENQMLERQVANLNTRNSAIEKQNAELKITVKQNIRKYESFKNKYQTLQHINSQLEASYLKKEQRLNKFQRDNELLKEKILYPEFRKAMADIEVAEDIDIEELKIKVRNCILILELFLNDPLEPLAPKHIQVEELHNIKTLLIEIDIKVKSLVDENDSLKKVGKENQEIVEELEDVNFRLASQSRGYEQLIKKLQEEFQKSISRNEKIQINHSLEVKEQIHQIKEQNSIEIKHMKQEMQTRALEYEVKLSALKNNNRKSQINLHNAYQEKQQELNSKLRELQKAHNDVIKQLRVLGPEKEETISRLYSSIHDLELELKLFKNKNQIADKNIQELKFVVKSSEESNQILQNNIKVILSSQGENLEELENYKLKEKEYVIRNENLSQEIAMVSEKIKVLEATNINLQAELQITQEEASEFYHRNQNITNQLNSRAFEFQSSKDRASTETVHLQQRVHQLSSEREEMEQMRVKQQKYHTSELAILKKNYQQKLDVLQRNYQESAKASRSLQQKVDNLTLINLQLLGELRRYDDHHVIRRMQDQTVEVQQTYYMESTMMNGRFIQS